MYEQSRRRLMDETSRFRKWANGVLSGPLTNVSAEWEMDYQAWGDIINAFTQFVQSCSYTGWDDEVMQTVLYLVARDNESGYLTDILTEDAARLLALASAAIDSSEIDARW